MQELLYDNLKIGENGRLYFAGADTVVVSSAIREANPELAAARAAGLRIIHRSRALAIIFVMMLL